MKGMPTGKGAKYGAAVAKTVGNKKQGVVNKAGPKHLQRVEKGHGSKGNILTQGSGKNLGSRSIKAQGLK